MGSGHVQLRFRVIDSLPGDSRAVENGRGGMLTRAVAGCSG